ncbi:MAG TPA: hypothetical protein VII53_07615 [Solirubrobacteraceae bacterium]
MGMQLTLVIRTVRTCRLGVAVFGAALRAGREGAAPGAVPPGLVASADAENPSKQHSSAEATAARGNMDR